MERKIIELWNGEYKKRILDQNMVLRKLAIITEESATMINSNKLVPALKLYGGSFKEIRHFYNSVKRKELVKPDLYIISSKYGLISGEDNVQPYSLEISSKQDAISTGAKLEIFQKFSNIIKQYDFLLISLTKRYFLILFNPRNSINFMRVLRREQILVIVTSNSLMNALKASVKQTGCKTYFFIRLGVSKIGKSNQKEIFSILGEKK